eukprot:gene6358-4583_t
MLPTLRLKYRVGKKNQRRTGKKTNPAPPPVVAEPEPMAKPAPAPVPGAEHVAAGSAPLEKALAVAPTLTEPEPPLSTKDAAPEPMKLSLETALAAKCGLTAPFMFYDRTEKCVVPNPAYDRTAMIAMAMLQARVVSALMEASPESAQAGPALQRLLDQLFRSNAGAQTRPSPITVGHAIAERTVQDFAKKVLCAKDTAGPWAGEVAAAMVRCQSAYESLPNFREQQQLQHGSADLQAAQQQALDDLCLCQTQLYCLFHDAAAPPLPAGSSKDGAAAAPLVRSTAPPPTQTPTTTAPATPSELLCSDADAGVTALVLTRPSTATPWGLTVVAGPNSCLWLVCAAPPLISLHSPAAKALLCGAENRLRLLRLNYINVEPSMLYSRSKVKSKGPTADAIAEAVSRANQMLEQATTIAMQLQVVKGKAKAVSTTSSSAVEKDAAVTTGASSADLPAAAPTEAQTSEAGSPEVPEAAVLKAASDVDAAVEAELDSQDEKGKAPPMNTKAKRAVPKAAADVDAAVHDEDVDDLKLQHETMLAAYAEEEAEQLAAERVPQPQSHQNLPVSDAVEQLGGLGEMAARSHQKAEKKKTKNAVEPLLLVNRACVESFEGGILHMTRPTTDGAWDLRLSFTTRDIHLVQLPCPASAAGCSHPVWKALKATSAGRVNWGVDSINGNVIAPPPPHPTPLIPPSSPFNADYISNCCFDSILLCIVSTCILHFVPTLSKGARGNAAALSLSAYPYIYMEQNRTKDIYFKRRGKKKKQGRARRFHLIEQRKEWFIFLPLRAHAPLLDLRIVAPSVICCPSYLARFGAFSKINILGRSRQVQIVEDAKPAKPGEIEVVLEVEPMCTEPFISGLVNGFSIGFQTEAVQDTNIIFENGKPAVEYNKIFKCFKKTGNGLLFRLVDTKAKRWYFYNDTPDYIMRCTCEFDNKKSVKLLGRAQATGTPANAPDGVIVSLEEEGKVKGAAGTSVEKKNGKIEVSMQIPPLATVVMLHGRPSNYDVAYAAESANRQDPEKGLVYVLSVDPLQTLPFVEGEITSYVFEFTANKKKSGGVSFTVMGGCNKTLSLRLTYTPLRPTTLTSFGFIFLLVVFLLLLLFHMATICKPLNVIPLSLFFPLLVQFLFVCLLLLLFSVSLTLEVLSARYSSDIKRRKGQTVETGHLCMSYLLLCMCAELLLFIVCLFTQLCVYECMGIGAMQLPIERFFRNTQLFLSFLVVIVCVPLGRPLPSRSLWEEGGVALPLAAGKHDSKRERTEGYKFEVYMYRHRHNYGMKGGVLTHTHTRPPEAQDETHNFFFLCCPLPDVWHTTPIRLFVNSRASCFFPTVPISLPRRRLPLPEVLLVLLGWRLSFYYYYYYYYYYRYTLQLVLYYYYYWLTIRFSRTPSCRVEGSRPFHSTESRPAIFGSILRLLSRYKIVRVSIALFLYFCFVRCFFPMSIFISFSPQETNIYQEEDGSKDPDISIQLPLCSLCLLGQFPYQRVPVVVVLTTLLLPPPYLFYLFIIIIIYYCVIHSHCELLIRLYTTLFIPSVSFIICHRYQQSLRIDSFIYLFIYLFIFSSFTPSSLVIIITLNVINFIIIIVVVVVVVVVIDFPYIGTIIRTHTGNDTLYYRTPSVCADHKKKRKEEEEEEEVKEKQLYICCFFFFPFRIAVDIIDSCDSLGVAMQFASPPTRSRDGADTDPLSQASTSPLSVASSAGMSVHSPATSPRSPIILSAAAAAATAARCGVPGAPAVVSVLPVRKPHQQHPHPQPQAGDPPQSTAPPPPIGTRTEEGPEPTPATALRPRPASASSSGISLPGESDTMASSISFFRSGPDVAYHECLPCFEGGVGLLYRLVAYYDAATAAPITSLLNQRQGDPPVSPDKEKHNEEDGEPHRSSNSSNATDSMGQGPKALARSFLPPRRWAFYNDTADITVRVVARFAAGSQLTSLDPSVWLTTLPPVKRHAGHATTPAAAVAGATAPFPLSNIVGMATGCGCGEGGHRAHSAHTTPLLPPPAGSSPRGAGSSFAVVSASYPRSLDEGNGEFDRLPRRRHPHRQQQLCSLSSPRHTRRRSSRSSSSPNNTAEGSERRTDGWRDPPLRSVKHANSSPCFYIDAVEGDGAPPDLGVSDMELRRLEQEAAEGLLGEEERGGWRQRHISGGPHAHGSSRQPADSSVDHPVDLKESPVSRSSSSSRSGSRSGSGTVPHASQTQPPAAADRDSSRSEGQTGAAGNVPLPAAPQALKKDVIRTADRIGRPPPLPSSLLSSMAPAEEECERERQGSPRSAPSSSSSSQASSRSGSRSGRHPVGGSGTGHGGLSASPRHGRHHPLDGHSHHMEWVYQAALDVPPGATVPFVEGLITAFHLDFHTEPTPCGDVDFHLAGPSPNISYHKLYKCFKHIDNGLCFRLVNDVLQEWYVYNDTASYVMRVMVDFAFPGEVEPLGDTVALTVPAGPEGQLASSSGPPGAGGVPFPGRRAGGDPSGGSGSRRHCVWALGSSSHSSGTFTPATPNPSTDFPIAGYPGGATYEIAVGPGCTSAFIRGNPSVYRLDVVADPVEGPVCDLPSAPPTTETQTSPVQQQRQEEEDKPRLSPSPPPPVPVLVDVAIPSTPTPQHPGKDQRQRRRERAEENTQPSHNEQQRTAPRTSPHEPHMHSPFPEQETECETEAEADGSGLASSAHRRLAPSPAAIPSRPHPVPSPPLPEMVVLPSSIPTEAAVTTGGAIVVPYRNGGPNPSIIPHISSVLRLTPYYTSSLSQEDRHHHHSSPRGGIDGPTAPALPVFHLVDTELDIWAVYNDDVRCSYRLSIAFAPVCTQVALAPGVELVNAATWRPLCIPVPLPEQERWDGSEASGRAQRVVSHHPPALWPNSPPPLFRCPSSWLVAVVTLPPLETVPLLVSPPLHFEMIIEPLPPLAHTHDAREDGIVPDASAVVLPREAGVLHAPSSLAPEAVHGFIIPAIPSPPPSPPGPSALHVENGGGVREQHAYSGEPGNPPVSPHPQLHSTPPQPGTENNSPLLVVAHETGTGIGLFESSSPPPPPHSQPFAFPLPPKPVVYRHRNSSSGSATIGAPRHHDPAHAVPQPMAEDQPEAEELALPPPHTSSGHRPGRRVAFVEAPPQVTLFSPSPRPDGVHHHDIPPPPPAWLVADDGQENTARGPQLFEMAGRTPSFTPPSRMEGRDREEQCTSASPLPQVEAKGGWWDGGTPVRDEVPAKAEEAVPPPSYRAPQRGAAGDAILQLSYVAGGSMSVVEGRCNTNEDDVDLASLGVVAHKEEVNTNIYKRKGITHPTKKKAFPKVIEQNCVCVFIIIKIIFLFSLFLQTFLSTIIAYDAHWSFIKQQQQQQQQFFWKLLMLLSIY